MGVSNFPTLNISRLLFHRSLHGHSYLLQGNLWLVNGDNICIPAQHLELLSNWHQGFYTRHLPYAEDAPDSAARKRKAEQPELFEF